jgi:hypothetical protein
MSNYNSIKQIHCPYVLTLDTQGHHSRDLYHVDNESGRCTLIKKNAKLDDVGVALVNGTIEYRDGKAWCIANDIPMDDWLWEFGLVVRILNRGLPNVPVS